MSNFTIKKQFWILESGLPKWLFLVKNKKVDITMEFCIFELVKVPNFTLNNFEFWDQICPKWVFLVKNRKSEHHHWVLHISIWLGTIFYIKQFRILGTHLPKMGISGQKQEKVNTTIEFCMFKLVLVPNFILNRQLIFWSRFAQKGYIWSETEKKKKITINFLYIWISLGTKLLLKLIILIFWTKFVQKGYFRSKTEKRGHHHWILHIWISLGTEFHFKQFLILGPNLPKNGTSGQKRKTWTSPVDLN